MKLSARCKEATEPSEKEAPLSRKSATATITYDDFDQKRATLRDNHSNRLLFPPSTSPLDSSQQKTQESADPGTANSSNVIIIQEYPEGDATKKSIDLYRSERYFLNEKSAQAQSLVNYDLMPSEVRSPTSDNKFFMLPTSPNNFPFGADEYRSYGVLTNITNASDSVFLSRDDFSYIKSEVNENEALGGSTRKTPFGFLSPRLLKLAGRNKKEQEAALNLSEEKRKAEERAKEAGKLKRRGEGPKLRDSEIIYEKENDSSSILGPAPEKKEDGEYSSRLVKSSTVGNLISPNQPNRSRSTKSTHAAETILVAERIEAANPSTEEIKRENKAMMSRYKEVGAKLDKLQGQEKQQFNPAPRPTFSGARSVRNNTPQSLRFSERGEIQYDPNALINYERERIKKLEAKLENKDNQLSHLKHLHDEALRALEETRGKIDHLRKDSDFKLADLRASIICFEEKNKKLEKENNTLKGELNLAKKELKERDALLAQRQQYGSDSSTFINDLENEVSELRKANAELQREVEQLKHEKEELGLKYLNKIEQFHYISQKTDQEMKLLMEKFNNQDQLSQSEHKTTRRSRSRKRVPSYAKEMTKQFSQSELVASGTSNHDTKAEVDDIEFRNTVHNNKTTQKFIESVTDLVVECSPRDHWKERPSLKQVWKWLKNLMLEYAKMKRQIDNGEDSEILQTCMEFLMARNKTDVVPLLHETLVGNTRMAQIISKFKIWSSLTSLETLDDLEAFLDKNNNKNGRLKI